MLTFGFIVKRSSRSMAGWGVLRTGHFGCGGVCVNMVSVKLGHDVSV